MPTLPTLFVSHGAPTLVTDPVPTREFLKQLGGRLPRPEAILCVSAHWTTTTPSLGSGAAPHTMYDFYGFPEPLYSMSYPAPGAPELAERAATLLDRAGLPAQQDEHRGLDHGAWVPLCLMYPKADIPVVQLSIQAFAGDPHTAPARHLALGRALAPLRGEGVLIVASGNATHNLREVFSHDMHEAPVPYAKGFADWLTARIESGGPDDVAALAGYLEKGPQAARNHPTPDHYLPLLVALGAALGEKDSAPGRLLHDGYTYGVLSMAAYAWGEGTAPVLTSTAGRP